MLQYSTWLLTTVKTSKPLTRLTLPLRKKMLQPYTTSNFHQLQKEIEYFFTATNTLSQ